MRALRRNEPVPYAQALGELTPSPLLPEEPEAEEDVEGADGEEDAS
jgi:hypothetical protein